MESDVDIPDAARELVEHLLDTGSLPALTDNVNEICSLTGKKDTCSGHLASIIMRDCGMTSNVLVTANSALYCPKYPLKTVSAAVTFLGFEKVRALVLGLEIFKQSVKNARNQNLMRLYANSYFSGSFAQALAREVRYGDPEEIFVAGLLFQLPRVALANSFPKKYQEVEQKVMDREGDLDYACLKVFGCSYTDICHALAESYRIPGKVTTILRGEVQDGDRMVALVDGGVQIAQMLFTEHDGNPESVHDLEARLQQLLANETFSLAEFIRKSCSDDANMKRFFNLAADDVDIMVRILEWGKASPARVVQGLSFRDENELSQTQDPELLIGHFFTELLLAGRRGDDVNHILMLAQEAIFRCICETHVFMAFYDTRKTRLEARFYAGDHSIVKASDFKVGCNRTESPIIQACNQQELYTWTNQDAALGLPTFITRKLRFRRAAMYPLNISDRNIGLVFIGRAIDKPFGDHELAWIEQICEHICKAFQRHTRNFASKTM